MGRYTSFSLVTGRYKTAATFGDATALENYFIRGAEDEVDSYAGLKYTVPFSPAPGFIVDLATDIAYYKMSYAQESAAVLKTSIDERVKRLIDGSITLVASGSMITGNNLTGLSETYGSAFGLDDATNWRPDADHLQDVEDARDG